MFTPDCLQAIAGHDNEHVCMYNLLVMYKGCDLVGVLGLKFAL